MDRKKGRIKNETGGDKPTPSTEWTQEKTKGTNGVTSITETNTWYYYYPNTLTTSESGTTKGIETISKAYKLLFRNADDTANCEYWVASTCVYANSNHSRFHLRYISTSDFIRSYYLWISNGNAYSPSIGVRAVVSIE